MPAPSMPTLASDDSLSEEIIRLANSDGNRRETLKGTQLATHDTEPLDFYSSAPRWVYVDSDNIPDSSFILSPSPTRRYDRPDHSLSPKRPCGTPDSSTFHDQESFGSRRIRVIPIGQKDATEEGHSEEKGKSKALAREGTELVEPLDTIEDDAQARGGLNQEDKDEQNRRDEELAIWLITEELRQSGYAESVIHEFLVERELVSTQQITTASEPPQPLSLSQAQAPKKSELQPSHSPLLQARRLLDSIYSRPLPPAYGPSYIPEPSTSQAGSPVIAPRRVSASGFERSESGTSNGTLTSCHSIELALETAAESDDEVRRAIEKELEAIFEANKAELLTDLERIERENEMLRQKREKASRRGTWIHLLGAAGTNVDWPAVAFAPSDEEEIHRKTSSKFYQGHARTSLSHLPHFSYGHRFRHSSGRYWEI